MSDDGRFTLHGIRLNYVQKAQIERLGVELTEEIVQEAHNVSGVAVGPTVFYSITAPLGAEITVPHYRDKRPLTMRWRHGNCDVTVKKTRDPKTIANEKIGGTVFIEENYGQATDAQTDAHGEGQHEQQELHRSGVGGGQ